MLLCITIYFLWFDTRVQGPGLEQVCQEEAQAGAHHHPQATPAHLGKGGWKCGGSQSFLTWLFPLSIAVQCTPTIMLVTICRSRPPTLPRAPTITTLHKVVVQVWHGGLGWWLTM